MIENIYKNKVGEESLNNQGCIMKIIEYINAHNIVIEFQDKYKEKIHTNYNNFIKGSIKNPYYPNVHGVGIVGNKYPVKINGKHTKEYIAWNSMLCRCFDKKYKKTHSTYQSVTCCEEWLLYENFYEWLHSQANFNKWLNGERWCIDKDILHKGNKVYDSKNCCLVPQNVNGLFIKENANRGDLPIGVSRDNRKNDFVVRCMNPFTGKKDYLGHHNNVDKAFQLYKLHKENLIKQVAQIEFDKGNITKECYKAMLSYEVEITD